MSRNRQLFPTGTVHPCKCCGIVFTVEASPNRTGEFCSTKCAHTFAGRKPRPKATKAWRNAERERKRAEDEADRAAAEERKVAEILARIQRKSEEAGAREKKLEEKRRLRDEKIWREDLEAILKSEAENIEADLALESLRGCQAQLAEEARHAPRPVRFWRRK